ncbi:hypothetical protein QOT17_002639 [Balamuthia mandrillaris]
MTSVGYHHIESLHKRAPEFFSLPFSHVYALEKIDGRPARLYFTLSSDKREPDDNKQNGSSSTLSEKSELHLFPGGTHPTAFARLFAPLPKLKKRMEKMARKHGWTTITIFGECYGGRDHGMEHTYGSELRFIAFDVSVRERSEEKKNKKKGQNDASNESAEEEESGEEEGEEHYLKVPFAEKVSKELGLDFVYWEKGPKDIEWLETQRDRPSVQARKNGIFEERIREGIIVKPASPSPPLSSASSSSSFSWTEETTTTTTTNGAEKKETTTTKKNFKADKEHKLCFADGTRVIGKMKGEPFCETKSCREMKVREGGGPMLEDPKEIAEEFVTKVRMDHVMNHLRALADKRDEESKKKEKQEEEKAEGKKTKKDETEEIVEEMVEDVKKESIGEVVWSTEAANQIRKRTRQLLSELRESKS